MNRQPISKLFAVALFFTLAGCGGVEAEDFESTATSEQSLRISTGAIGDACTVDGKQGKCTVSDCSKCEVDGMCWQKINDGSWAICLKPFPSMSVSGW